MSSAQSAGLYSHSDYRQAFFPASSLLPQKVGAVQNPKPGNKLFELQTEVGFHNVSNESCTLNSKGLQKKELKKEVKFVNNLFLPVQLTELTT